MKLRRKRRLERLADITGTSTSTAASHSVEEEEEEEGRAQRKRAGPHYSHPQNHPRRFSWDELERFSSNFSRVVGSGGFSTVYLSQFPDSSLGAIKMIHGGSSSQRLHRLFKQELDILLRLRHDNIVELLGYSDDDREESVLVFKYVPNGNLQDKLHTARTRRRRGGRKIAAGAGGDDDDEEEEEGVLSWNSRIKIAFQLAQALEYLHHKCPLQIVHGDIKASNILLDHHLNCKLCDFGSARMGFASSVLPSTSSSSSAAAAASRTMFGSPGYTDPHYLRTGIASRKNDVFSFGVILLELITGREALCSRTGHKLTSIAAPALRDPSKLPHLLDPRLLRDEEDGPELLEQVKVMASISAMCLCDSPALRPSASDILNAIATPLLFISSSSSSCNA